MATNVDTLQIEIGASSSDAAAKVKALADEVLRLKQALGGNWRNPIGNIQNSASGGSANGGNNAANNNRRLLNNANQTTRIRVDSSDVDKAVKKIRVLSGLLNSLKRIAYYRLIRTIIKEITKAFEEGTENAYWFSRTVGGQIGYVAEAFDRLAGESFTMKNQLGAAWATLKASIVPILVDIVNLATTAANALTQFFAALGGKNVYMRATDQTKQWADATSKGASAAKEWKNQLMGFDEINRLEEPGGGSSGSGANDTPNYAEMFEVAPVNQKLQDIMAVFKKHLEELKLLAYGAEFAIGLFLALSGSNVPLGLALMIHGGYKLVKTAKENWSYLTSNIKKSLGSIGMLAGGLSIGIGLALAMTGVNVPLGLGLVAAGLLTGASAASISWDEIPDKVGEAIGKITTVVGTGIAAIGLVLLLATPQFSMFGLALLVGGLSMSGMGIAANWENMPNKVQSVVDDIMLVIGSAGMVIGAILAFSGANIPLGIALMVVGASSLASVEALSWGDIRTKLQGEIGLIAEILGGAALVLGAILVFSGVGVPLGIALIGVGAAAMVTVIRANWDYISSVIKASLASALAIISGFNLVIGVLLCLSGIGIGLGLALIYAGIKGSQKAWSISSNPITEFIRGVANSVVGIFNEMVSGIEAAINGIIGNVNAVLSYINSAGEFFGFAINANINYVKLPRAQTFASGGFPEDGFFFANHNELVGQFANGKTAVANNDQIVQGIHDGVEDANEPLVSAVIAGFAQVIQAINNNGRDGDFDLASLSRAVSKNQARTARAAGV